MSFELSIGGMGHKEGVQTFPSWAIRSWEYRTPVCPKQRMTMILGENEEFAVMWARDVPAGIPRCFIPYAANNPDTVPAGVEYILYAARANRSEKVYDVWRESEVLVGVLKSDIAACMPSRPYHPLEWAKSWADAGYRVTVR